MKKISRKQFIGLSAASLAATLVGVPAFGSIRNDLLKTGGLTGGRFLTFNAVIRVNQIEVTRNKNIGQDERKLHTPERVKEFRGAIEKGCPGAKITWALSWLALHDESKNYNEIRKLVTEYHFKYGDEVTFIPGAYFSNAYNTREQINLDLTEALAKVSDIVGNGYRPKSIVAGFLAAENLKYLAEKENIHVCQGNIWSQYAIDMQDGDGSVSYPYYPSTEHFCKPAQGKNDFIDCVNLDGWTMDFLAARREGNKEGFNSRMGVGPIETFMNYGEETGLKEVLHTASIHYDKGFELNKFAWVTDCWEVSLPYTGLTSFFSAIKKRWPDVKVITQGEFGLLWRKHFKQNDFNYRFVEKGSGIGGSDENMEIRWFMNKDFRLALLHDWKLKTEEQVIDFTRYDLKAEEPKELTRSWSLMGKINQKQTRAQDKPVSLNELTDEDKNLIYKRIPELHL
ncbi:MAG: DUF3863 domain-containing protein [Ignavibacteriaceae bacterium]|nr:DUF3863 domain-containing protein [Ignavibacteriaceae bacterium]